MNSAPVALPRTSSTIATGCSAAAVTTVANRPTQTAIACFIPTSIQPGSMIRTDVAAVSASITLLWASGSNTPSVADVCDERHFIALHEGAAHAIARAADAEMNNP